jgi:hypothetical protein
MRANLLKRLNNAKDKDAVAVVVLRHVQLAPPMNNLLTLRAHGDDVMVSWPSPEEVTALEQRVRPTRTLQANLQPSTSTLL